MKKKKYIWISALILTLALACGGLLGCGERVDVESGAKIILNVECDADVLVTSSRGEVKSEGKTHTITLSDRLAVSVSVSASGYKTLLLTFDASSLAGGEVVRQVVLASEQNIIYCSALVPVEANLACSSKNAVITRKSNNFIVTLPTQTACVLEFSAPNFASRSVSVAAADFVGGYAFVDTKLVGEGKRLLSVYCDEWSGLNSLLSVDFRRYIGEKAGETMFFELDSDTIAPLLDAYGNCAAVIDASKASGEYGLAPIDIRTANARQNGMLYAPIAYNDTLTRNAFYMKTADGYTAVSLDNYEVQGLRLAVFGAGDIVMVRKNDGENEDYSAYEFTLSASEIFTASQFESHKTEQKQLVDEQGVPIFAARAIKYNNVKVDKFTLSPLSDTDIANNGVQFYEFSEQKYAFDGLTYTITEFYQKLYELKFQMDWGEYGYLSNAETYFMYGFSLDGGFYSGVKLASSTDGIYFEAEIIAYENSVVSAYHQAYVKPTASEISERVGDIPLVIIAKKIKFAGFTRMYSYNDYLARNGDIVEFLQTKGEGADTENKAYIEMSFQKVGDSGELFQTNRETFYARLDTQIQVRAILRFASAQWQGAATLTSAPLSAKAYTESFERTPPDNALTTTIKFPTHQDNTQPPKENP